MTTIRRYKYARASIMALAMAIASTGDAHAQIVLNDTLNDVPLNDQDCYYDYNISSQVCLPLGNRQVTYNSTSRSGISGTQDLVQYRYDVDYEGSLDLGGILVVTNPEDYGYTPSVRDLDFNFDSSSSNISVISSYTGVVGIVVDKGAATPVAADGSEYPAFLQYENMSTTVTGLDINNDFVNFNISGNGLVEESYAEGYIYTIDPYAISNGNQVEIGGAFGGEEDNETSIFFGKISGTATLRDGGLQTEPPYDSYYGDNAYAISPYQLDMDVDAVITTMLDENGLMTPHVEVNQAIEMNGSRITGLANGVAMDDAATVAQVMAAMNGSPQIAISGYASASVTAASATAIGDGTSASGVSSSAFGAGAAAKADYSAAVGFKTEASGLRSVAVGTLTKATGKDAMAIGVKAAATGTLSSALGYEANATGGRAAAIGSQAIASASAATAIGTSAVAAHNNSTAIGYQAKTTSINQVALGGAGSSVKVGDIDASTAAQEGQLYSVTVDETGTLGRGTALATGQQVASLASQMQYVAAVSDAQFNALTGRVDVLDDRVDALEFDLNEMDERASGGIAAAMALGGTAIVPGKSISMTVSAATWGGEQGFAGSLAGRVNDGMYVSAGVTGDTGSSKVGGRVAATFGF